MSVFRFKEFYVKQEQSAMKVGTDAMLLGALVQSRKPDTILDIGTGTGVIALMLAQRFSRAKIAAVELDALSAEEASFNFRNSPWNSHLSIIQSDFLEYAFDQSFDLIVSNPPYYQSRLENKEERKAQTRHESALPMNLMLEKVFGLLTDSGAFWVIIPSEIENVWIEAAEKNYLDCVSKISIIGKEEGPVKRVILQFKRNSENLGGSFPSLKTLTIRDANNAYTDAYIELTKDFHYNSLR